MSESKIKTIVEVDASQLDETIKKAEKLISLLEKANSLINELANKEWLLFYINLKIYLFAANRAKTFTRFKTSEGRQAF